MNSLINWAMSQKISSDFDPKMWTKTVDSNLVLPKLFNGSMVNKVLGAKLDHFISTDKKFDLNNTYLLGGTCLLSRADMKKISSKEIVFDSLKDFERWFSGWYPRIDQVHDTIGMPYKVCKEIIYVVEDSFFAERLARQTGFEKCKIESILRNVHQEQGHRIIQNWLRNFGYSENISVVYTSTIERDLNLCLKIWERLLGFTFRACDNEFAKVELMYTGFWLDILGISNSAIIYEPASKLIVKGWIHTKDWIANNQYGTGINKNLGIVGYIPFISGEQELSNVHFNQVPNFSNFKDYKIADENLLWYATNFLFPKKIMLENGPISLSSEAIRNAIDADLKQYYSI